MNTQNRLCTIMNIYLIEIESYPFGYNHVGNLQGIVPSGLDDTPRVIHQCIG